MKSYLRIGCAALVALNISACATVTRGTKQAYVIESTPAGADVELSTGQKCKTPCALKLKRKHGFTVHMNKAGYEPIEAKVESGVSGGGGVAMAGNLILGGLIGGVVDGTNGSMNDLKPNPLSVILTPLAQHLEALSGAAMVTPAPAPAATAPATPKR
jgi:hypothetical protein